MLQLLLITALLLKSRCQAELFYSDSDFVILEDFAEDTWHCKTYEYTYDNHSLIHRNRANCIEQNRPIFSSILTAWTLLGLPQLPFLVDPHIHVADAKKIIDTAASLSIDISRIYNDFYLNITYGDSILQEIDTFRSYCDAGNFLSAFRLCGNKNPTRKFGKLWRFFPSNKQEIYAIETEKGNVFTNNCIEKKGIFHCQRNSEIDSSFIYFKDRDLIKEMEKDEIYPFLLDAPQTRNLDFQQNSDDGFSFLQGKATMLVPFWAATLFLIILVIIFFSFCFY